MCLKRDFSWLGGGDLWPYRTYIAAVTFQRIKSSDRKYPGWDTDTALLGGKDRKNIDYDWKIV